MVFKGLYKSLHASQRSSEIRGRDSNGQAERGEWWEFGPCATVEFVGRFFSDYTCQMRQLIQCQLFDFCSSALPKRNCLLHFDFSERNTDEAGQLRIGQFE